MRGQPQLLHHLLVDYVGWLVKCTDSHSPGWLGWGGVGWGEIKYTDSHTAGWWDGWVGWLNGGG